MKVLAMLLVLPLAMVQRALADVSTHSAQVDESASTLRHPLSKSIWTIADNGDAIHLQSRLTCPARINAFRRVDIRVYKQSGLDVSCNYRNEDRSLITIYLTKRRDQTVADDFEEAKRELVQITPDALPVREARQMEIDSARAFQQIIYSEKNEARHSGIWLADLDGWSLEYRATYAVGDDQAVVGELSALTTNAERTAGQHLDLCARAGVPTRDGVLITDKETIEDFSVISGAALAEEAIKKTAQNPIRPSFWCAEGLVGNPTRLLWRAVFDEGTDALADRLTPIDDSSELVLTSSTSQTANQILNEEHKSTSREKPMWSVGVVNEGKTWLFAYYDGRPDGSILASILMDIVASKVKPVVGYANNTIYVDTPATK